jgi:hypothetical protein
VGLKERDARRTVCYCFGHTVESIREEIETTGRSTVAAAITAKVNATECSCEILNPKGTCCLGDVNKAVKEALAGIEIRQPEATQSPAVAKSAYAGCCRPAARGTQGEAVACGLPLPAPAEEPP